jgi:epoxyqueuosine reductase
MSRPVPDNSALGLEPWPGAAWAGESERRLGNWCSPAAVPVLSRALSDPEPLVRARAAWALGKVGSAEAKSALSTAASAEKESAVLDELSAAMDA